MSARVIPLSLTNYKQNQFFAQNFTSFSLSLTNYKHNYKLDCWLKAALSLTNYKLRAVPSFPMSNVPEIS